MNFNAFIKSVYFMLILALISVPTQSQAVPKKNLWPRWEVNDPVSTKTIDHQNWDYFLKKYLVTNDEGINLVRYGAVTESDKQELKEYIWKMSKVVIDNYNRDEQLAFWINLYNAITVKLVLDHYPVDSIKDINISPGLFAIGPWDANVIKVENKSITLNDIEHRILRPIWNDPRIHYALNCASIGCPNLQQSAFTGKNIENELNEAAKTYINSLRGVQVIDKKIVASKIFEWYQKDFGGSVKSVLNHIRLFASPELKAKMQGVETITDYVYNWHINEKQ